MTSSEYRSLARENLKGNYWQSVVVAFVAMVVGATLCGGSVFNVQLDGEDLSVLPRVLVQYFAFIATIGSIVSFVGFIIGGCVQLGYATYLLKQHNRAHFDLQDLFSQFDRFKDGFLQRLLRGVYTILWSLLFVIPGIVKNYAYAMTPFIMSENPNMSANEAITASRELMNGHKGELFMLDLSFIGWDILAALTLNIGHIFLNPYRHAAYAAFYKDITAPKN